MIKLPIGPFKDFADCVAHFKDDPDISDPEKFCAWMEQEEKEGKITHGDKVIWGAEVEFMSLVSTPAVTDSEFLQIKEKAKDPNKIMVKGHIPLLRRKSQDDDSDIYYAPALIPDKADGNREAISKEEIKKAAIKYMEEYRKVDNEHSFMDGDGVPIFSWILQKDEVLTKLDGTEKMYPEGTWMMGIKVTNPEVKKMIENGERTGFSIAGSWKVLEIKSTNKSQSSSSEEQPITKVKEMEPEEVKELAMEVYAAMKAAEAKEQSQKEAEETITKLKEELATVKTALEELKASKQDDDEEDEEKEDEEEEEGEKQDDEEEEEEEEKNLEEKATKSYDDKKPELKDEKKDSDKQQTKGIGNAKITIKREPLGDINHE